MSGSCNFQTLVKPGFLSGYIPNFNVPFIAQMKHYLVP